MRQVAYTRGDLKLSDHRSVCATFIAEVEVVSHRKLKKACIYPKNIKLIDLETEKVCFGVSSHMIEYSMFVGVHSLVRWIFIFLRETAY